MILIRSIVFNILFYILTIGTLVIGSLFYFFLSWRGCMGVVTWWSKQVLRLLRVVCGTRYELRGRENIPAGGFIFAGKHQSLWETFALLPTFTAPPPAYVIKRELLYVPVWGWWAQRAHMIFVDRGGGTAALRGIVSRAKQELAAGRAIMIFPEGTRRAPGAPPDYKPGIAFLYRSLGVPVVGAGINSGLYWPRRKFLRYPGTIVVEFLPPIPPGLRADAFQERLQAEIEASSDRLLMEAADGPSTPPLPESAVERIRVLRGG
jgi:1-acyl-sn-glycerol-3-phosphate acyltransferase